MERMNCVGRKLKSGFRRASPTILTCIGAAGVIATAVISAKATPKALILLKQAEQDKEEKLTKLEQIKTAAPVYIPAAMIGLSTIICIFSANALNRKQQAAITSAYALASNTYKKYQGKVKELLGMESHQKVLDSIAAEKCTDTHITAETVMTNTTLDFGITEEPEIIRTFFDTFSNRYFESTISKVIEAEYHLNRNFMLAGVIALNDFYDFLGLEKTEYGDMLGWSQCSGDIYWIDFNHHKVDIEDGIEVFVIDMPYEPTDDFLEDI